MSGSTPRGFNADERSQRRTEGPVVIGGVTFHPRKLTNKSLRQVRAISRRAQKEAREAAEASEEYAETLKELDEQLSEDATEDDRKRNKNIALMEGLMCDRADEINESAVVEQLKLLVVDDNQQPPEHEQLVTLVSEQLDSRDQVELMQYLMGPDPTPSEPEPATQT
jgi:hypothetical protein